MSAARLEMHADAQALYVTNEKICQYKSVNKSLEISLQDHAVDNVSLSPEHLWAGWLQQLDEFKSSHLLKLPDMQWDLVATQNKKGQIYWEYLVYATAVKNVKSKITIRNVNLPSYLSPLWEPSFYHGIDKGYFSVHLQ